MVLTPEFLAQPTPLIARGLLGTCLYHETAEGVCAGLIVETEAYLGRDDPAAHSFRGPRERTRSLFGPAGHAYVYQIYGLHYCINVVTGGVSGSGEAVLIRALQPTEGIPLMQQRRQKEDILQLCSGPAKLVQALAIRPDQDGHDLRTPPLFLTGQSAADQEIVTTTRIGISQAKEMPLRFYLRGNPYISKT